MPNFCPNCGHQLTETLEPANSPAMTIDENFVFDFGKNRGMTVKQLIVSNPSYLFWVNRNIDYLEVPDEILAQCNVKPNRSPQPLSPWDEDLDDDIPF